MYIDLLMINANEAELNDLVTAAQAIWSECLEKMPGHTQPDAMMPAQNTSVHLVQVLPINLQRRPS